MPKLLDFIIIGGHGTGLNALTAYMRRMRGVRVSTAMGEDLLDSVPLLLAAGSAGMHGGSVHIGAAQAGVEPDGVIPDGAGRDGADCGGTQGNGAGHDAIQGNGGERNDTQRDSTQYNSTQCNGTQAGDTGRTPHQSTGIFVDTSFKEDAARGEKLTRLRGFCRQGMTLIILRRDPVEQILSILNTHIRWWAHVVSGLSNKKLRSTLVHCCASRNTFLHCIIDSPNLTPCTELVPLLAPQCGRMLFVDMAELVPPRDDATLTRLGLALTGRADAWPGSGLASCAYTQVNRFVGTIFCICGDADFPFTLEPCPVEFAPLLGREGAVYRCPPQQIGFTLGEFYGDIAFYPRPGEAAAAGLTPEVYAARIRAALGADLPAVIRAYTQEVAQRQAKAEEIFAAHKLDADALALEAAQDAPLAARLRHLMDGHSALMRKYDAAFVPEQWGKTIYLQDIML